MTFGKGRRRTTVGLPGTGISYTTTTRTDKPESSPQAEEGSGSGFWLLVFLAVTAYIIWKVASAG